MARSVVVAVMLCLVSGMACGRSLKVSGNRAVVDGQRGQILYRDTGDLDGDGARETVFAVLRYSDPCPLIVVARRTSTGWNVIATTEDGYYELRTDVTDVNGDGREEIVARGTSGDGHGW